MYTRIFMGIGMAVGVVYLSLGHDALSWQYWLTMALIAGSYSCGFFEAKRTQGDG